MNRLQSTLAALSARADGLRGTDPVLIVILTLALALRLVALWLAPHPDLIGDEREYYSAAAILADGRGLVFFDQSLWVRSPLYIFLLAGLFRLGGPVLWPVWTLQVVLSLALVALVYLLARLIFPRQTTARLAALLSALYLPFAVYAGLLLSETLFTVLFVAACVALTFHARRGGVVPLFVAGGTLGLAVLTRGSALPFLAAIPLWALILGDWRAALRRSCLVIGLALLVIAPWTARNAFAYRAFIPVETTGGYNFWLGAQGGRNAGQIDATLRDIPNQGERQSVAWVRGWGLVRADPAAYATKAVKEAGDVWRLNFGAFERLLRGYALGRVPTVWLALTFVLDDLLYLMALPLAVLGWTQLTRRADRWLLGLWLGWNCAAGAIFFAISRFRLPLMPFVLLLTAAGVVALADWWHAGRPIAWRQPQRWLAPALVGLLLVALVLPTIAPDQYLLGAQRRQDADRLAGGYTLLQAGRAAEAVATFEPLPTAFYARSTALAAAYNALGQPDRALELLDNDRDPLGATLLRGDIFRRLGRSAEAFEALNYRDVRIANPTKEAWDHLAPPSLARLDVGNGLDLGYVYGVHLDERDSDGTTYRWTTAQAEFRLTASREQGGLLRLRLRGYRPNAAPPQVTIKVNSQSVGTVTPTTEWQVFTIAVPPGSGQQIVRLETTTFVPSYTDQRQLGVMLDWLELVPDTR